MYRGSLKKCVAMMAYQLTVGNYPRLTIIDKSRSKTYSLMTDDEAAKLYDLPSLDRPRTVACLTYKELRSFTSFIQTNLNLMEPPRD